jgi:succinoglycan biosynthesis transport protein ExoP
VLPRETGNPETPPAVPVVPAVSARQPSSALTAGRGAAAAPPPAIAASPDAAALLKALGRRWVAALCLCLLAGAGALAGAWFLVPAKYAVSATVQVASTNPNPVQKNQWRVDQFPIVMKTQAARIKNKDILVRALDTAKVRRLALLRAFPDTASVITWLDKELKTDFQDGSEFLTVTLDSEVPEQAAVLLDAIVQAYLAVVTGKEHSQRHERVAKARSMIQQAKDRLNEKITSRDILCKHQGAPDSAAVLDKHRALQAQLSQAQQQQFQAQLELEKAQARLAGQRAARKLVDISTVPDAYLQHELHLDQSLKGKLDLQAMLEKAVVTMKIAGHPDDDITLVQTQKRLAALNQDVETRRETVRQGVLARYQEKAEADRQALIAQLEQEIRPLENAVQRATARADGLAREVATVGVSTARLEILSGEIKQAEAGLADLQKQLQELQLEEASDFRVSLGQDAGWLNQTSKKRLILLLLIPLAAVGGTAFAVAWLEFRARRIHTAEEVVAGLGLRLVGAVPALTRLRQQHPALQAPPGELGHSLGESIDAIRTMLLRSAGADGTRVVMVTSAVAAEGKTTLASNLAMSLARAGRRTVLVDGDLRRPAAHQLFEQTLQPGLSEVLLGEVELADAVRPTTSDENLWLLPAGQWDRAVLAELAKEGPGSVFGRLRQEFDFVVVDSHPVLPAADSLLVGQHMDGVILSVMRQVSQAPRVHAANQRLATLGIRIYGAVVNGMPVEEFGSGYAYRLHVARV